VLLFCLSRSYASSVINTARYLECKLDIGAFSLIGGQVIIGRITNSTLLAMQFGGNCFQLFPARLAKQVMFERIRSKVNKIIFEDNFKQVLIFRTIIPQQDDVLEISFVVLAGHCKWILMLNDIIQRRDLMD
jgi:hypothetical protein